MGLFLIHIIQSSHLDILKLNAPTRTKTELHLNPVPLLGSVVLHGSKTLHLQRNYVYFAHVQGQMAVGGDHGVTLWFLLTKASVWRG